MLPEAGGLRDERADSILSRRASSVLSEMALPPCGMGLDYWRSTIGNRWLVRDHVLTAPEGFLDLMWRGGRHSGERLIIALKLWLVRTEPVSCHLLRSGTRSSFPSED